MLLHPHGGAWRCLYNEALAEFGGREGWTDVRGSGPLKHVLSSSVLLAQVKPASLLILISLGINILTVEIGRALSVLNGIRHFS